MAVERVTERTDGTVVTERREDGPSYVERETASGGGVSGILIAFAVLALVVIIGFFLMNANRNDAVRADAVSDAASSVSQSVSGAAESVSSAAESVAAP
jgi:hypothetical protein